MSKPKIIVRSYKRSHLIQERTLRVLGNQKDIDLSSQLYIVVHKSEVGEYEKALQDFPKAGFIVKKEKGGHKSIEAARRFFAEGEKLLFLDDDIPEITHYVGQPSAEAGEPLDCLGRYMDDAFSTLDRIGAASWTVKFLSNLLWMSKKPWKQFRPHHMSGNFWGAYNSDLFLTDWAHEDDFLRCARYIEEYGGTLVYNWFTSKGNDDILPGGMQSSGDRGENILERTKEICDEIWESDALYRKYCYPPSLQAYRGVYTSKLRPISSIRKIRPHKTTSWSGYFQEKPDSSETDAVEKSFNQIFGV